MESGVQMIGFCFSRDSRAFPFKSPISIRELIGDEQRERTDATRL